MPSQFANVLLTAWAPRPTAALIDAAQRLAKNIPCFLENNCSKIIVQAEYEAEQAILQQLAGTAETAAA